MAGREQQVEKAIQTAGVTVSGLKVRDGGQVISLWGSVPSEDAKRKAEQVVAGMGVKVANHLTSGASAGLAGAPASSAAGASASGGARAGSTYVVKSGDSLSKIAKHAYGDASKWKAIHAANAAKIPNPDLIHPGDELVIPPA